MTEENLNERLMLAMKEKDAVKISVLRMLKADIGREKIAKNILSLDEAGVLRLVNKHIKQHLDSIEQFEKGGRVDLAEKEKGELRVLKLYVPDQMDDNELNSILRRVLDEMAGATAKEMGAVIKKVMENAGGRADGKRISQAVRDALKVPRGGI
ncbi:MAG: GatB/YqeY domain-containing protein [Candidatus Omnitrophota bacterium]